MKIIVIKLVEQVVIYGVVITSVVVLGVLPQLIFGSFVAIISSKISLEDVVCNEVFMLLSIIGWIVAATYINEKVKLFTKVG